MFMSAEVVKVGIKIDFSRTGTQKHAESRETQVNKFESVCARDRDPHMQKYETDNFCCFFSLNRRVDNSKN